MSPHDEDRTLRCVSMRALLIQKGRKTKSKIKKNKREVWILNAFNQSFLFGIVQREVTKKN